MIPGVQKPHWLAPVAAQAPGPRVAHVLGQAVGGGDLPTGDTPDGRDAGDPGLAVDEDRATPALALGTTAVLDRHDPQLLAQHVEQGQAVVGDPDEPSVDAQLDGHRAPPRAASGRRGARDGRDREHTGRRIG
ncbi:MAG: hypothetical protein U5R31_16460 [Acidimicrobiia bacterium]|nr:hypothetical protein [Acidimicrobiia bacterium]